MRTVRDADLARLLRMLSDDEDQSGEAARLVPAPGESVEEWLLQVRAARARADRGAVRHRQRLDAVSRSLFGASLADLLGGVHLLVRSQVTVPVRPHAQLRDLVPALDGVAPAGPISPASVADAVSVSVTAHPEAITGVIRLHGGAFWMGGGATRTTIDSGVSDYIARTTRSAVFDVDYRLAPEHPYPASIIDALSVIDAVREGLAGVSVSALALMGTSSGANTAFIAARADSLRQHALPLSAIALTVPSLLLSDGPPELRDDPRAWRLRLAQLRGYLGDAIDPADPWVSPGSENVIRGMPPTFMAVAEYDDVAWGAEALRDALIAGGNAMTMNVYPMTHVTAAPRIEMAVIRDATDFLRIRLEASANRSSPPSRHQPAGAG